MSQTRAEGASPAGAGEGAGLVGVVVGIAGALVVAAGLRYASDITGPALLGIVLVVTVAPLNGWLRRRGVSGGGALLATAVATYGILLLLAATLVLAVDQLVALLPDYQARFTELTNQVLEWLSHLGVTTGSLRKTLRGIDPKSLAGPLRSLVGGVTGVGSQVVFLLIALYFLVLEVGSFGRRLDAVGASRPYLAEALRGFAVSTRRYMVVSTVFGLIVAVLDALALWLLGVPLAWLWGLFAFVTNYIPNIGFVIGVIPPALLALLDEGLGRAVSVVVVFTVLNVVIQSFIQPKFVGDSVGLSPFISFLSLFVWTLVVGPIGAVLAIPLTLLLKALVIDTNPARAWVTLLIADDGPSTTGASLPSEAPEEPPAPDSPTGGSPAGEARALG